MSNKKMLVSGVLLILLGILSCTAANATPVLLSNVPDYAWTDGCSPTSATMMMAYYDINGYKGLSYSNLIPGGVAPLNTFATSNSEVTNAINIMASDMGTDSSGGSLDYYFTNGQRFTAQNSLNYGYKTGIVYGLWQYVNQAGYVDPMTNFFNQAIYSSTAPFGFTFADYENSINAGIPVLIELTGHTMLGYGYDPTNDTVYVHDTWGSGGGTMTWGGSYGGMTMTGVTDAILEGGTVATPEPSTILLIGSGLLGLIGLPRKRLGRSCDANGAE
jgi:hypothetical protein